MQLLIRLREVNTRKAEMSALQNCRFNISSAAKEHLLGPDSEMKMRMYYKVSKIIYNLGMHCGGIISQLLKMYLLV